MPGWTRWCEPPSTAPIELSRKIIEDAGYAPADISRVVLIGGPTKMPLLRARVGAELGIAVEDPLRVDPMTAVAMGAAIYCDSRDWSGPASVAKPLRASGEAGAAIAVGYDYDARTAAHGQAAARAHRRAGWVAVQVESALGWSSGRVALDAPVELTLPLADPGPNRFRALVFDPLGRPVPDAGQEFDDRARAGRQRGHPGLADRSA